MSLVAIYNSMMAISFTKKLVLLRLNNTLLCIQFTPYPLYDEYKIYCSPSIWLSILLYRKRTVVYTQLTFPSIQIYILFVKNMHENKKKQRVYTLSKKL